MVERLSNTQNIMVRFHLVIEYIVVASSDADFKSPNWMMTYIKFITG